MTYKDKASYGSTPPCNLIQPQNKISCFPESQSYFPENEFILCGKSNDFWEIHSHTLRHDSNFIFFDQANKKTVKSQEAKAGAKFARSEVCLMCLYIDVHVDECGGNIVYGNTFPTS